MSRTCYLYHIRRQCDSGVLTEGYIGISYTPHERFKQHKRRNTNKHLSAAIEKYNDIELFIVTSGSRSEMLRLEKYLRPHDNIGWNVTEGGGDPPDNSSYWRGRIRSEEHNKNLSASLKGRKTSLETRAKLSVTSSKSNNPSWSGYYLIDGIYYSTKEEASKNLGVSHSTVTYRCKKLKKVLVNGKQSLVQSPKDNFPTWKFIPKENILITEKL